MVSLFKRLQFIFFLFLTVTLNKNKNKFSKGVHYFILPHIAQIPISHLTYLFQTSFRSDSGKS